MGNPFVSVCSLSRMIRVALFAALALTALSGCSDKQDPTDPEGAYNIFRDALFQGDADGVWQRLAATTHSYFGEQHARLVQMDGTIEKYLPQTDHMIAREQAGSILTDEVSDGKSLFTKVFTPKTLPQDEAYRLGSNVSEVEVAEDEKFARIKTLAGQEYVLSRGDRDEWFVMLIKSSEAVQGRLTWVETNESALKQTIEDLIAEERKEREAIIAELLKPE